jgi:hypothetical protein
VNGHQGQRIVCYPRHLSLVQLDQSLSIPDRGVYLCELMERRVVIGCIQGAAQVVYSEGWPLAQLQHLRDPAMMQ